MLSASGWFGGDRGSKRVSLTDKAVIITGAASGIGRATAELAASRGASCCLSDIALADVEAVAEGIRAKELEHIIAAHEAVAACAMAGLGEAVTALVVLEGKSASAEELMDMCRERLSRYKIPKEVRFVADLPRNSMGKLIHGRLSVETGDAEAVRTEAGRSS
jgi:acyl-CoA synthetase (AMP-forming)/AMP-acid ligase II